MMIAKKREKVKLLYELEKLVNKNNKILAERQRIKVIRETIDVESSKAPGRTEIFDLKLFNSYRVKFPEMNYNELAKLMGIKPNSLYVARKRHGLIEKKEGAMN